LRATVAQISVAVKAAVGRCAAGLGAPFARRLRPQCFALK